MNFLAPAEQLCIRTPLIKLWWHTLYVVVIVVVLGKKKLDITNMGEVYKKTKKNIITFYIILFYHKRVKLLVIDLDMNLEILLMGLFRGWCTGDRNWTGGVKKPPGIIPPPPGPTPPIGVCQEDEDISESGLLSKLFLTLHIPILPSLLPVKTWLLLVVIVLIVELSAFISPTKAQVSTDHNLMYPALQPETVKGKKGKIINRGNIRSGISNMGLAFTQRRARKF